MALFPVCGVFTTKPLKWYKSMILKEFFKERRERGQTLIETMFVIVLLLIMIFAIAEFARGWYLKNSLNNAARIGARFAAVDPVITAGDNNDPEITGKVITQPGVPPGSVVNVALTGDTVTVTVKILFPNGFSYFGGFIPGLGDITELSSSAAMRYEQ